MYDKQFLVCKKTDKVEGLNNSVVFADLKVLYHEKLNVCSAENDLYHAVLIGDVYDYQFVDDTNKQILERAIGKGGFSGNSLDNCCGAFIVLYTDKKTGEVQVFSDSTGARECFYLKENQISYLASTTILLNVVCELEKDDSTLANTFFSSDSFKKKLTYVGNKTEYKNVLRLKPNKELNLINGTLTRFFPLRKREECSLEDGAKQSAEMLKGFLTAINNRSLVAIPVSAGWDSRVLLAASKDISQDVYYYIFQLPEMTDNHQDIVIPNKLLANLGLKLNVLKSDKELDLKKYDQIKKSISYPRAYNFRYLFNQVETFLFDKVKLGGNVSEIARNEWDAVNLEKNTAKTAFLQKYPNSEYAMKAYQEWLDKDMEAVKKADYNVSDLIYWEENCPNWMGKGNTEIRMVSEIIHPFNSRALSKTMLAVNAKYRAKHNPKLYKRITEILWPETLQVPVNPSFKKRVISFLQKIGVYGVYREVLINLQLLKLKLKKGTK